MIHRDLIDYSLYLVTDRPLCGARSLEDVVGQAVRAGATVVQLREKEASSREFFELALRLLGVTKQHGIPLIINDRIDIALASGADGVHIGQSDLPYAQARRILGPQAIIGLSIETPEQARQAEQLDADYFGVSPIFLTPTKIELETSWGLDGLRALRKTTRRKLVAIGGINASNAAPVIEAGADGLAVVSAICAAGSPAAATADLLQIIRRAQHSCAEPRNGQTS